MNKIAAKTVGKAPSVLKIRFDYAIDITRFRLFRKRK